MSPKEVFRTIDLSKPPPEPEPLLTSTMEGTEGEELLRRGKVSLVATNSYMMRQELGFRLALSVASGRPWLDSYQPRQGKAIFAAGHQDGFDNAHRNFKRLEGGLSPGELELAETELCPVNTQRIKRDGRLDYFREYEAHLGDISLIVFEKMVDFYHSRPLEYLIELEAWSQLPGNPSVVVCHTFNPRSPPHPLLELAKRSEPLRVSGEPLSSQVTMHHFWYSGSYHESS